MSDTVTAALIGAASTVAVALIGRKGSERQEAAGRRRLPGQNLPTRAWLVTALFLVAWLLVSPGILGHDFAGTNFFVVPIVFIVLALVRPIRPLTGAWVSLGVFSANFFLGPLANQLAHSRFDTQFIESGKIPTVLLIGFAGAALVAAVCWWRLPNVEATTPAPSRDAEERGGGVVAPDITLSTSLEKLASLHASGALSDEEFRKAKARLLGTSMV